MNIFFVVTGILFIFNSIPIGLSLTLSNRNCITVEPTAIDDPECKKYYICIYDETGSLVSYDTSCPASMVFDPSTKNCVPSTNFVCKITSISTTPTTSTSTTSTTSTSTTPTTSTSTTPTTSTSTTPTTSTSTTPSTTPTPCNGRFQITGDTTCKKYYFCYTDAVTTIRYNLTCPNNLQFNPITQRCVLPCTVSNKCPPCS
ncbi:hypothetical protein K0M31_002010 [Melipona bicolor]|uniref:Chitin-binding type-2 domain-containing protein n=1 Tax=Melipona bicolor TaxID=60889 RepID=A0AA40GGY2_9HYME|nr:hypothetical protein K0M31_002010 [Melipona bicolor]